MKSRYSSPAPLPSADTVFLVAFNIMADKVLEMAKEYKDTHGEIVLELMTPLEREEYDWLVATWASVRLNALYLLNKNDIQP